MQSRTLWHSDAVCSERDAFTTLLDTLKLLGLHFWWPKLPLHLELHCNAGRNAGPLHILRMRYVCSQDRFLYILTHNNTKVSNLNYGKCTKGDDGMSARSLMIMMTDSAELLKILQSTTQGTTE